MDFKSRAVRRLVELHAQEMRRHSRRSLTFRVTA